jgi:hypothetical protein
MSETSQLDILHTAVYGGRLESLLVRGYLRRDPAKARFSRYLRKFRQRMLKINVLDSCIPKPAVKCAPTATRKIWQSPAFETLRFVPVSSSSAIRSQLPKTIRVAQRLTPPTREELRQRREDAENLILNRLEGLVRKGLNAGSAEVRA